MTSPVPGTLAGSEGGSSSNGGVAGGANAASAANKVTAPSSPESAAGKVRAPYIWQTVAKNALLLLRSLHTWDSHGAVEILGWHSSHPHAQLVWRAKLAMAGYPN